MQLVLNGILFCFILLLCGFSFAVGLHIGYKRKIKPTPKELSEEDKRKLENLKRQEENFWNYNGSAQDKT